MNSAGFTDWTFTALNREARAWEKVSTTPSVHIRRWPTKPQTSSSLSAARPAAKLSGLLALPCRRTRGPRVAVGDARPLLTPVAACDISAPNPKSVIYVLNEYTHLIFSPLRRSLGAGGRKSNRVTQRSIA
jgi:hypothetical protein